jgi:hypothetical protein
MNKKADVEIQFNWIFVLIAGAVILAFFVSIVNNQKDISEQKIAYTSLTNLETIFIGAESTVGTMHNITIPNIDIKFECDKYYVGETKKDTKDMVIFAPNIIKGKLMQALTLDFSLPFRLTNMVYLTHPNIRYIFVYKDENKKLFDEVNSTLPDNFKRETVTNLPTDNKNNYKVKVIFFDTTKTGDFTKLGTDVKILEVYSAENNENSRKIIFYNSSTTTQTNISYYFETSSLIGAIFTEDIDTYNCVMNKALKKAGIVYRIYQKRTDYLASEYSGTCYPHYVNANETLNLLSGKANEGVTIGTMSTLTSQSLGILTDKNQNLIYQSCPTIY